MTKLVTRPNAQWGVRKEIIKQLTEHPDGLTAARIYEEGRKSYYFERSTMRGLLSSMPELEKIPVRCEHCQYASLIYKLKP